MDDEAEDAHRWDGDYSFHWSQDTAKDLIREGEDDDCAWSINKRPISNFRKPSSTFKIANFQCHINMNTYYYTEA
jgi:hypothetical protein